MAPTDPSDCYASSPFGFGPFPDPSDPDAVYVCPPHPVGSGYGGAGTNPDGGSPYGLGAYGDATFPAPKIPISGGYGGDPYGLGPYGSLDDSEAELSSAISLNGFEIEVFFSQEMDPQDPGLIDPASYTITELVGAPVQVTAVRIETIDSTDITLGDFSAGVLSVVLTHTGTTLGGTYQIAAQGFNNIAGNPILPTTVNFLTKGYTPQHIVQVVSATELDVVFDQPILEAAQEPVGITGVLDASSYDFESSYPIALNIQSITHPVGVDFNRIRLEVEGQTSTTYTSNIVPSLAIDYDGSILPDAATDFVGVEVNPAGGASVIGSQDLILSRQPNESYGWLFQDTSGIISPANSTLRVDVSFDASSAVYTPALAAPVTVATLSVEDAAPGLGVLVQVLLQKDALGEDQIQILSGTFNTTVSQIWSDQARTISVVRNQKVEIYTILLDDCPIVATDLSNMTGVSSVVGAAGAAFTLNSTPSSVSGFRVGGVTYTSSNTIFSQAWNFIHGSSNSFVGSSDLTQDTILTQKGPLTKGWGDATLATINDVEVLVGGVSVPIASVNPYNGEIVVKTPIPFTSNPDVKVNYTWFHAPIAPLLLNTEGSNLNHYLRADDTRFPMRQVLSPVEPCSREQPVSIGHSFLAYERQYSAVLNEPNTLVLNAESSTDLVRTPEGENFFFEGEQDPNLDWDLNGVDTGELVPNEGTYCLIDASSETPATYSRLVDTTFPSSASVVARFFLKSWTLDGVFTGVCFGTHNNQNIYQVGALEVNGLKHVGLLQDVENPQLAESWFIGPQLQFEYLNQTAFRSSVAVLPSGVEVGQRFQIIDGAQAGVYTVTSITLDADCLNGQVDFTPALPVDINTQTGANPTAVWETPWDQQPSTYRLTLDFDSRSAQLLLSGALATTIADGLTITASPLETFENGQAFWGSCSNNAKNSSLWSFFRYSTTPDVTTIRTKGVNVLTEMDTLPEDDVNTPWFLTQDAGESSVVGGVLTLAKQDASALFGYKRIEPLYKPDLLFDFRTSLSVDQATQGYGNAQVILNNTIRQVEFSDLLFTENPGELVFRKLISIPQISTFGPQIPTPSQWQASNPNTLTQTFEGSDLVFTQTVGSSGGYFGTLSDAENYTDPLSRAFEANFRVDSFTGGDPGVLLGADVNNAFVGLVLKTGPTRVSLVTAGQTPVQDYAFDWEDGLNHTYRVVVDVVGDTVALFLDGVLQTPTLNFSTLFSGGSGNNSCFFGVLDLNGVSTSKTSWSYVNVVGLLPTDGSIKRTVGVLTRNGSPEDINSWEIPRSDSSTAPNSSEVGPIVQEVPLTSLTEIRMLCDPDWGVTVFIHSLGVPPYFQPETPGVVGSGFFSQTTEPSAGWINVEYAYLPLNRKTFGDVFFGVREPSIAKNQFEFVRYRFYRDVDLDFTTPQGMVLNQYNVIHSGELHEDTTPEIATLAPSSNTTVSLTPNHIYASVVHKIIDGGVTYTSLEYAFDSNTQIATLLPDDLGEPRTFSNSDLTVVFSPGNPTTNTYLASEPSLTVLNEGTPPVPKSYAYTTSPVILEDGDFADPPFIGDPDTGFLNDEYRVLTLEDVSEFAQPQYIDFEHITKSDNGVTGLLTPICEGGLTKGFSGYSETEEKPVGSWVLDFSGTLFTETFQNSLVSNPFNPSENARRFFIASGGNQVNPGSTPGTFDPLGGLLSQSDLVLYPITPTRQQDGPESTPFWDVSISSVLTDPVTTEELSEDFSSLLADNTPPTLPSSFDSNPNGVAGAFGGAYLVETLPGDYSRVGPWAGLVGLSALPDQGFFEMTDPAVDGTVVSIQELDSATVRSFVARNVPVGANEFAITPTPHIGLANVINADPIASTWVRAEAGLSPTGDLRVTIYALAPIGANNELALTSNNTASIRLAGLLILSPGVGLLGGGSQLTQSSLIAGGAFTLTSLEDQTHNPQKGLLVAGGTVLPVDKIRVLS